MEVEPGTIVPPPMGTPPGGMGVLRFLGAHRMKQKGRLENLRLFCPTFSILGKHKKGDYATGLPYNIGLL